jgi:hypothetical protein
MYHDQNPELDARRLMHKLCTAVVGVSQALFWPSRDC